MSSSAIPKATPFDSAVAEVQAKIEEMNTTLVTLLRLQADYGGAPSAPVRGGGETEISHDSFFGMTIADAAKKYLSMMKATKSTAEIAEALERGGLKHSSKSFPTTLRSILGPREDFTRVPNGDWGLSDWYPGQGRGKKAKPEKPKRKAHKKRAKAKAEVTSAPIKAPATNHAEARGVKPGIRVKAYSEHHPGATPQQIADALGISFRVVKVILSKKPKAAAA